MKTRLAKLALPLLLLPVFLLSGCVDGFYVSTSPAPAYYGSGYNSSYVTYNRPYARTYYSGYSYQPRYYNSGYYNRPYYNRPYARSYYY